MWQSGGKGQAQVRVPSHEFLRTTFFPQKENFLNKYFPKVKYLESGACSGILFLARNAVCSRE